jgi:hypothetical protein
MKEANLVSLKRAFSSRIVFIHVAFLFFLPIIAHAQQNIPLDRDVIQPFDKLLNEKNTDYHTAVKPFQVNELMAVTDSSIGYRHYKVHRPSGPVSILVSPSELSGGYDFVTRQSLYKTTGTIGIGFCYTTKLAIVLNYSGGSALFPSYQDSTIKFTHMVPGVGRSYARGREYLYQDYFGYVSFSPNKIVNFQIGKDKHFFGDGYRSMILSDNASSYPFIKIQTHIWKIKWVNLFTMMQDATAPSGLEKDFKTKYSSMQYLSWNATKRLNISLFEAIVWQGNDTNRVRGFDINYMNPVLFYRPTEYSLGSADNAFIGLAGKLKLPHQVQLYGQILLDEFLLKELLARKGWWGNKYALQAGLKLFDLLGIKNLYMLAEFNYVRPYTYSHGSVQQNYGHMNQPLADPLGANFEEIIGILNYRTGRFIIEAKACAALTGLDTGNSNIGQNIFLPYTKHIEYGNYVGQGRKTIIATADLRLAYLIMPSINLKAELGLSYHTQREQGMNKSDAALITFGIKTALHNTYHDY